MTEHEKRDDVERTRETVRLQREAYMRAIADFCIWPHDSIGLAAKRAYPMPPVERPRVVTVDGCQYRIANGRIEYNDSYEGWRPVTETWERIYRAFADLLARPTETIPDEEENND